VTVNGISIGQATDATYEKFEGASGYVNAAQWRNRGIGYWLVNDGGVDASPFTGTYGWHLSAITRNIMDWSEIRDFEDPRTGFPIPVTQADQQTVKNATYKQGVISKVNGRTRWAQFPMKDFTSLFGFSGVGGHQIPQTGRPIAPPDLSGVASNT
jgi:hypothetical protein